VGGFREDSAQKILRAHAPTRFTRLRSPECPSRSPDGLPEPLRCALSQRLLRSVRVVEEALCAFHDPRAEVWVGRLCHWHDLRVTLGGARLYSRTMQWVVL
jgi:hypothetical protein